MVEPVKANLLAAFRYLLKPLVRLAVKNAVAFPEFSESLKLAYVDVAVAQIKLSGKTPTEEGISLITSVPIAEVGSVLRGKSAPEFALDASQDTNPLPRALSGWHTDARYTGPYGVLRDLQFAPALTSVGISDDFADLASRYCPGTDPKVLLDELIRTGCVQPVGNDFYRAVRRSYVPDPLSGASILIFARVVHNLCEAAELNLRPESVSGNGLMQRNVYTRYGVSAKDLREFDKFIRNRGQMFADDIDNWLSDRDREGSQNTIKTGVGFYHYIVNDEDELALSKQLPN